mgnify:FL=1
MERFSNIDSDSSARSKYTKSYFGNYLGIVVQNNDPEKRGRLKVFVPHISSTVYSNWDSLILKNKHFKFIGENIDSDLTPIIDDLKEYLPWAECAAPLAGGSASGRYNAHTRQGSISDSNKVSTISPNADVPDTEHKLNTDGIGESVARKYEVKGLYVKDAFDDTAANTTGNPNNVNKFTESYIPSSYSNCAKGSFAIPNVGSHVWVFFQGGDPLKPVIFAASYGAEDWQAIYDSSDGDHGIDYPGTYENKSPQDNPAYNHNTETYRNKYVINQKGGSLEFVNTDNREILRMTHFSGSFKEFNNHTTTELAANNDQKLVLADQFLTVRGHKNEFVEKDLDLIVRGDFYKKVGNFNKEKFQEWHDKVQSIADIKQLFEIKRAAYTDTGELAFQKQSPAQNRSGTFAACPLCAHPERQRYWNIDNSSNLTSLAKPTVSSITTDVFISVAPTGAATGFEYIQPVNNPTNFMGSGSNCPVCNGTGLSPSTKDGTWDSEDKMEKVSQKIRNEIEDLAEIEKSLGIGGSEISHITKHKVETIGLVMNDFPSIRIDEVGKINVSEVLIKPDGVVNSLATSPLIEYVHVDDLPGGSYNLNVCNRYNLQVGAGGLRMKTYGPIEIGGTITNIGGEQVNISSENEININGGKRLTITAEILTLRQKNYKQVVVDSNLGVTRNVVIGGGLHVEGELSVNHITAPVEIQETEQTKLYAKAVTGIKIGECIVTGGSSAGTYSVYGTNAAEDSILCYDHSHQFKNVPLHLMESSDDVRKVAEKNNKQTKIPAAPVENENKGGGLEAEGETIE